MARNIIIALFLAVFVLVVSFLSRDTFVAGSGGTENVRRMASTTAEISAVVPPPASHIKTPEYVKAVYMSACAAATPSLRKHIEDLIDSTELNAVVIDIKDFSGTVSFDTTVPSFRDGKGKGCKAHDMPAFVEELHKKQIYVIGRITVFQDPLYTRLHPETAVRRLSDGGIWSDFKGLHFIDVGAKEYWDEIVALSIDSYRIGFDELNFDYIRFPSDGNMKDISFTRTGTTTKAVMMKNFFAYLHGKLNPEGIVTSADLFGMTTTNTDDLNIGQVLENTLPYFDFVSPMVYPSHYPPRFNGWSNPNKYPYDVVYFSMDKAVDRAVAASTSPLKLRPWLQDFDYGGIYNAPEVRAQMNAVYDTGLTSWMLWDPANKYTRGALEE